MLYGAVNIGPKQTTTARDWGSRKGVYIFSGAIIIFVLFRHSLFFVPFFRSPVKVHNCNMII